MHYKNPIDCSNLHEKQNKIEIIEKEIWKKSAKIIFNQNVAYECIGVLMHYERLVAWKVPHNHWMYSY